MDSDSSDANLLLTLLGVVAGPINGQVGVQCSPITLIGKSNGASWYANSPYHYVSRFELIFLTLLQFFPAGVLQQQPIQCVSYIFISFIFDTANLNFMRRCHRHWLLAHQHQRLRFSLR
jgi:hypothetical protein